MEETPLRVAWAQSTRRHGIGRAHVHVVMATAEPTWATRITGEPEITWQGADDRGVALTVIGVLIEADLVLLIHVMPDYRPKEK